MSESGHSDAITARRDVVAAARVILDGTLGVVEGSRRIAWLRHDVDPTQEDEHLLSIAGIESQTDHLPIGDWRREWDPEALARFDAEREECERFFRDQAMEACRAIVSRYATTTLYRPVGARELELVAESGWRAFPPRLPEQPIFYPVLTREYAVEIARDWNTKDAASGHVGYVLRYAVDTAFLARYPVRVAGARRHQELWVPAEELEEFNRHVVGKIEMIEEFRRSG